MRAFRRPTATYPAVRGVELFVGLTSGDGYKTLSEPIASDPTVSSCARAVISEGSPAWLLQEAGLFLMLLGPKMFGERLPAPRLAWAADLPLLRQDGCAPCLAGQRRRCTTTTCLAGFCKPHARKASMNTGNGATTATSTASSSIARYVGSLLAYMPLVLRHSTRTSSHSLTRVRCLPGLGQIRAGRHHSTGPGDPCAPSRVRPPRPDAALT